MYATDDPEISSHPANCLMVESVNALIRDSIQQFDQSTFYESIYVLIKGATE